MEDSQQEIIEVSDSRIGLQGWVVIDSVREGLSFGGLRMHPSVDLEVVRGLAESMTYKLAGHGLPVGGAKGGIRGDPRDPAFRSKVSRFGELLSSELRTRVILGKDVGASDDLMAALYEGAGIPQLLPVQERARAEDRKHAVPDRMSQLRGYIPRMTALGVVTAAQAATGGLKGKTALIQGAGVVGAGVAHRLTELGARVVGMSDHRQSIYRASGFSAQELEGGLQSGELCPEKMGAGIQTGPTDELFGRGADVLFLAALSNTVTIDLARRIRARMIIEGANFALLPDARRELHRLEACVIPDVIASSSSSAMVTHQMRSRNSMSEPELWGSILESIESHTREVTRTIRSTEPREAFIRSISRLIEGSRPRK